MERILSIAGEYILANSVAFALGALFIIALGSIVVIICSSIAMSRLYVALKELKKARLEIRSHAPLKATVGKSFDERRKEEYEKRGIPWEENDKKGG